MSQDFYHQLVTLEDTKPEDGGGIRFSNHTHLAVEVDYAYDSAHARESGGNQSACGTFFCLYCAMMLADLGLIYLPEAIDPKISTVPKNASNGELQRQWSGSDLSVRIRWTRKLTTMIELG